MSAPGRVFTQPGSFSDLGADDRDVRSTPINRHHDPDGLRLKSAKKRKVLALVFPEAAEGFPEIAGFKILRVPLSPRQCRRIRKGRQNLKANFQSIGCRNRAELLTLGDVDRGG